MQKLRIQCPECGKDTVIDGKCISCGYILWDVDKSKLKHIESESKHEPKGPVAEWCPFCKKKTLINGFCHECGFEKESAPSVDDVSIDDDRSSEDTSSKGSNGFSIFALIIGILLVGWGLANLFNVEIFVGCVRLK